MLIPTNDVSSATTAYDDLGRADLTRSRRSAFFDNFRQIIGRHRLHVRITIYSYAKQSNTISFDKQSDFEHNWEPHS